MSQYPSLAHTVTQALVDLAWFVESAGPERMDPDDAVRALEDVAAVVDRMPDVQRAKFLQVIAVIAAAETDPGRREFLEAFPGTFALGDAEAGPAGAQRSSEPR